MKKIGSLAKILAKSFDSIKKNTGVSTGFYDPDTWISTGNYALNYRISGKFDGGIPLGKVVMFAGETGSGKSFVVSGNIVKKAQEMGIFVILIDTENALDKKWLHNIGVDTSPDKILRITMANINDLGKFTYEFMANYREENGKLPNEEREKVLIVVDSIGMLQTDVSMEQMKKGDMKGDMGHKPRQLKSYITNCVNQIGSLNIGMVCVNHSYDSQNIYDPDPKISGGQGLVYASSIVVLMQKRKLKTGDVESGSEESSKFAGIVSKCKVTKTRFAKPFEEIEIQIPYESGMSPYSGLFNMFESMGLYTKSGNQYIYADIETGEEYKMFKKDWNKNKNNLLDLMMKQFYTHPEIAKIVVEEQSEDYGHDFDDE